MRDIQGSEKNQIAAKGCSFNRLCSFEFMREILFVSLFVNWLLPLSAQHVTISGFVTDNSNGETLIGANVYDSETFIGITTNNRGFFSLTLGNGPKTIHISYIGYETKSYRLNLVHDTTINISIISGVELDEVHVISSKSETDFSRGRLTLPMVKLLEIPAILGEADLLKAMTTYPGIAQSNEGSSGIIVRGGSTDQNLFILDGIQVYNTGHLFNFISVFNPEAIKRIDFYKSAFPSKYGGRLSSVTDIIFKDGNNNHFKGSFEIGLINSKVTLEGPVNDKTTFLIAVRSTYFDLFTPFRRARIKNKQKFQTSWEPVDEEMVLYTFADVNFKLNHTFNNKNSISFNLYSGADFYRILNKYELQDESNRYTLLNNVAALKSMHIFNPKLYASTMIGFTSNDGISKLENTIYHKYVVRDPITGLLNNSTVFERLDRSEQKSFVRDFSYAIDFSYYPNSLNTLNFGALGIKHFYEPGVYTKEVTDTIGNKVPSLTKLSNKGYNSIEDALYIEDELKLNDKILIIAGARFNLFKCNNKTFTSIDPRFSISATTSNSGSFIFGYSRMNQSNHALIRDDLLMYKTIWVPSMDGLVPEKSDQFSLGFNKSYEEKGYSLQAEYFYKTMKNLVEYNINYLSEFAYYDWEKSLITKGDGQSYGIELSGQKTKGIFTCNFNYTLSWYYRRFTELNNGKWFPYIFDRRHILNVTSAFQMNKSWKLSLLWTISSGHRLNMPIAYINSNPYAYGYFVYDGINSQRLPVYHRLDLGAEWQRKGKNGEPYGFRFSLYNAYFRLNAYYLYVDREYKYDSRGNIIGNNAVVKKKTFLPMIPSINYFYKF